MRALRHLAIAAAATVAISPSAKAAATFQFYVFPLDAIVGISKAAGGSSNAAQSAMVDQATADAYLDVNAQRQLTAYLKQKIRTIYPKAAVSPVQVGSGNSGGPYAYLDSTSCPAAGSAFSVSYKNAYAVTLGVSRASTYVNRFANLVQVLIPVTLNIQFTKLNGAQVAFSKSETIYTALEATSDEYFDAYGKVKADISGALYRTLSANLKSATDRLVQAAQAGFNPQQKTVQVLGKDGEYVVFDRGNEIGFSSGQSFEGVNEKGVPLLFDIVRTQPGITVAVASKLTPEAARVGSGENLEFLFSGQGRDDSKPELMPVFMHASAADASSARHDAMRNALAELFSADVGFNAPFSLAKEDADFDLLKQEIRAEANCDSSIYARMPGFSGNDTVKRKMPGYFVSFDYATSPAMRSVGVGGVNTLDVFQSAVLAKVFDQSATVVHSSLGAEEYSLERSGHKGLSLDQAREVALKNANMATTRQLLSDFRPEPRSFTVTAVEKGRFRVDGNVPASLLNKLEVLHPLKIRSGATSAMAPVANFGIDASKPIESEGKQSWISSVGNTSAVRTGDVLMGFDARSSGGEQIARCEGDTFLAKNAANPDVSLVPLVVSHALVRSNKFTEVETNPNTVSSVQALLSKGFYDGQLQVKGAPALCYTPAAIIRNEQSSTCGAQLCSGTGTFGVGLILKRAGAEVKRDVAGWTTQYKEIPELQLSNFFGEKGFEFMAKGYGDLVKKINSYQLQ